MVGLAPRAPGDSVRPRRLSGVVVRPLNFTVRAHERDLGIRRQKWVVWDASAKASFGGNAMCALRAQQVTSLGG